MVKKTKRKKEKEIKWRQPEIGINPLDLIVSHTLRFCVMNYLIEFLQRKRKINNYDALLSICVGMV